MLVLFSIYKGFVMSSSKKSKKLPPHLDSLIFALRRMGYDLDQSIGDLLDNCINAKASKIRIVFQYNDMEILKFAIIDDGFGMGGAVIDEAMRFGSETEKELDSLGKYGMGMKLASIAQAGELTVISLGQNSSTWEGRKWTIESLSDDWRCDSPDLDEINILRNQLNTNREIDGSGTAVIWEKIDGIKVKKMAVGKSLRRIINNLKTYIGLHFHRFIEDEGLEIVIESKHVDEVDEYTSEEVFSLDPFPKQEESPSGTYPEIFAANIEGLGKLDMYCAIWQPNSNAMEYKLGGNAAAKQGFYFYRNNRLIQAGGWNGLVNADSEPHGSLARVAINLPSELDQYFRLSTQKHKIITPENFVDSVKDAETSNGIPFNAFRSEAQQIYRKKSKKAKLQDIIVPNAGIPKPVVKKIRRQASEVYNKEGKNLLQYRNINFEWSHFQEELLFKIDRKEDRILLNKAFRSQLLLGEKGSPTDIPLIKMLLMFLVKEDFKKTKWSADRKKEIEYMNMVFISTLKFRR